jgi:hypothetical protein
VFGRDCGSKQLNGAHRGGDVLRNPVALFIGGYIRYGFADVF